MSAETNAGKVKSHDRRDSDSDPGVPGRDPDRLYDKVEVM